MKINTYIDWLVLMLWKLFFITGIILCVNGCSPLMTRMVMDPGFAANSIHFPPPYTSNLNMTNSGQKEVEYQILGEGFGESVGYSVLFGFGYHQMPDYMAAYKMAVDSQEGDFLVESRRQLQTEGYLSPFLWTKYTFKIWGMVAKVEED